VEIKKEKLAKNRVPNERKLRT